MAASRKLAELFYDLRVRTEGVQQDVATSERHLGRLTKFVIANPVAAFAAIGTAAAAAAIAAVSMATRIESSMNRVKASLPAGASGIESLQKALKDISIETGKSQEDLAAAAETIARTGAGTAEEVATRLRAAVDTSQASGVDLNEIIGGLDQTLDLFGLSALDSAAALATLFDAAKGRTNLGELFGQLQAAAPGIQKLGLDLPTAARALVALGESGLSAKQAASALKQLAEDGAKGRAEVERLAASIPASVDAMQRLKQSARDVNEESANAAARIKAEFTASMIELGMELKRVTNPAIGALLELIAGFRGRITQSGASAAFKQFADNFDLAVTNSKKFRTESAAVGNALKQLSTAALAGQDVFSQLGSKGLDEFMGQLNQLRDQALAEGMKSRITQLDQIASAANKAAEGLRKAATAGKGVATSPTGSGAEDAAVERLKALGQGGSSAFEDGNAKMRKSLDEASQKFETFFADQLKRRIEFNRALIATGAATADTFAQLVTDIEAQLRAGGASEAEIPVLRDAALGLKTLRAALADVKREMEEIALKGQATLNRSIEKDKERREKAAKDLQDAERKANAEGSRLAQNIEHMGRAVIAAGDAFGFLTDEAAKALGAIVDVGAGIARAFGENPAAGIAQGLGGLITLASQAFGKDPAAQQRQREHQENLATLRGIEKNTGDLLGIQASGADISRITAGIEGLFKMAGPGGGFRRFSESGINEASSLESLTQLPFKQIEALAKSLGITLNGTRQSYLDFLQALKALDLEAFGKGFAGQMRKLEIEARLDPTAFDGLDGVIKRLKVLLDPTDGAPAIIRAIGGIPTDTVEGRAAAIEKLTELLRNVGSLDVADLGGLSLDQFIEEILRAIEGLRAAQPIAKTASQQFADAMEAIGVQVEFGSVTAKERLDKALEAFTKAFPDLSALVDTSSAEAFKASVQTIIDGFAADGELTDAEKAQIDILRTLIGVFNDATPAAEKFTDSLQALLDQFEIFGISAKDQVELLINEFTNPTRVAGNKDFDLLKGLADGLDLSSSEGVAALRERAKQIVLQLAEGGITEEEQAVIEALKRIIGTAERAAGDAAKEATDAAERERERRRKILADAEGAIQFEDVQDPAEILRRRIKAVSDAFPALAGALENIDLTTEEGRAAFDSLLTHLRETFAESSELADLMGLSVEEILDALGFLEGGLDSLAGSVLSVAEQINAALSDLEIDLDIEGITDPIERLKRAAKTAAGVEKSIDNALRGIDLGTEDGRKKAESALQALAAGANSDLKEIILRLLNQIRGLPSSDSSQGAAAAVSSAAGRENVVSAASITEVTANRWLDIMVTDLALSRERNALLESILATSTRSIMQAPAIAFPSTQNTQSAASAPGVTLQFNLGGVNFYAPVTTADASELADGIRRSLYDFVQREMSGDLLLSLQRLGISRAGLA